MIHTMHNGFSKPSISQLWSKFAIWGTENPNAAIGALTVSHLWTRLLFFLLIGFRYWHLCIMLNVGSKHKQMVEIERALIYDVKTFSFCMQGKYGIPVTKLKLRLSEKEARLFFFGSWLPFFPPSSQFLYFCLMIPRLCYLTPTV